MELKIKTLARFTMPLFVAATLAACGSENITPTPEGAVKAGENQAVIYVMSDTVSRAASDMTLHVWNKAECNALDGNQIENYDSASDSTNWALGGITASGSDDNGYYWVLPLKSQETDDCFNFIVRDGASQSGDLKLEFAKIADRQAFVSPDYAAILDNPEDLPPVALAGLKGAFIDATTIALETVRGDSFELHYLPNGGFKLDETGEFVSASTQVLPLTAKDMPAGVAKRYASYKAFAFTLPEGVALDTLLQGQLVVVAKNAEDKVIEATGMQLAPALDAVYANAETEPAKDETLGAVVNGTAATFKLWAPTAKNVALYLYDADLAQTGDAVTMTRKANGTWETADVADALGKYYRYEVQVYHAALDNVETLQVTDPYSLSLSANSKYSQVVNLATQAKPADWDTHIIPTVERPEQLVIYETHLRDLSSAPNDGGTDALDGKYTAITETDRASVKQLTSLADNGMNVLHLMNVFDIATVDEDPGKHVELSDTVAKLCGLNASAAVCSGDQSVTLRDLLDSFDPASGEAQALMNALRAYDSFNWGYDPFHYTTPEGSYATDAKGTVRIEEYRTLIMALHAMGYRVVMDVVYNHTNSAGTDDKSVLDKIVPGYYQRLNASGYVETSTCCSNTATENIMMGKLMTDSLVTWGKEYKIDGFRFDLMGHQPKQLMVDSLAAVKVVDSDTYFYGEGWNFGEVVDDTLFVQATQANMAGTEIGTFSDRLRDAVRGGSPFDSQDQLRQNQGFATAGIWNEMQTDTAASTVKLRQDGDLIRVGMAGNLANFVIRDQAGDTKRGQDVDYNGQKAGYTADPQENISYVSKHDNQTLWDNNMYKVDAGVTSAERAQMQILALSTNMLGQGIPFFHMGSELLRSKSMQRDSYDSGDWFNTVNYDMSSNNWNVGLPREDKDGANWPLITKIIADANANPTVADIEWTDARFKELLKIRTSSPLFSLATEADVKARVDFQNTGLASVPGVIVMSIDDGISAGADLDPAADAIVTVINATEQTQTIPVTGATGFTLHSALITGSASFAEGKFTVPALTTAVFVQAQGDSQGAGLAVDNSTKDLSSIPPFGDDIPHIRGDMNGWGDTNAMEFTGSGVYSMTMTLDAGTYGFKVADPTWGAINYGTSGSALVLGEALLLDGGDNISLTLDVNAVVTFKFDANDKSAATLTVTAE